MTLVTAMKAKEAVRAGVEKLCSLEGSQIIEGLQSPKEKVSISEEGKPLSI